MSRLTVGSKFPNEAVLTLKGDKNIADMVSKEGKTAVVFLRYYGCSLSQFDVKLYSEGYEKITAGGNELVVVLQSTPESIERQCPIKVPFDIICDPLAKLYKELDIEAVADISEAKGEMTMDKINFLRTTTDIVHGDYEGIEEQLPAYFVVDADLNVLHAHYSEELGDVPSPDCFAKLFA